MRREGTAGPTARQAKSSPFEAIDEQLRQWRAAAVDQRGLQTKPFPRFGHRLQPRAGLDAIAPILASRRRPRDLKHDKFDVELFYGSPSVGNVKAHERSPLLPLSIDQAVLHSLALSRSAPPYRRT